MASKRDYYEVLGLDRSARPEEVKKAYRQKALQYHPDRNPGDKQSEESFKEAAEAYSVLIDPEKRNIYDRFGHDGLRAGGAEGFDPSVFQDFEDILGNFFGFSFGDFFGGGARSRERAGRGEPGRDLAMELEIGLGEAAAGVEREVNLNRAEACPVCGGTGAKPGTRPETCPTCGGRGQVRFQQGFFTLARTCPQCRGAGRIVASPCEECRGSGRVRRRRTLKVRVPAGVSEGMRMRIGGEGDAGEGGAPAGDLYVLLHIAKHPFFEREGSDLTCEVEITVFQAALGARLEIPTLDGETETLKVPAGTQSGEVFRLKGRGIRDYETRRKGDLFVRVRVRTPTGLGKDEKALLLKLAEMRGETPPEVDASAVRKARPPAAREREN